MDLLRETLEYCRQGAVSPEYAAAIIQHLDIGPQVEKVKVWILKNVKKAFNKREAHQRLRGRVAFRRISELDDCLSILEMQGLLRKESRYTGGRPAIWYHRLDTPSSFDPSDIQHLERLL